MTSPLRYFNSSPEIIRLAAMMYVRYPLSLRNVEDLLARRRARSGRRILLHRHAFNDR
jgi:transposase-like protein